MTFSYYNLRALREQPRHREHWAVSLDLVLSRLNALERYANQPLSSWYGTDPNTKVVYGVPILSTWPHCRITYTGAPERRYIRGRVDELRGIIGAPPFPWLYTPDKHNFDVEPHRMCGLDSRALLEMLQAIGREYGGSVTSGAYIAHHKVTQNGVVTEYDDAPSREAIASYYLSHAYSCYYNASGAAHWDYNWPGEIFERDDFDMTLHNLQGAEVEALWINSVEAIVSSRPYESTGIHLKDNAVLDWVETEGGSRVLILNSDSSGITGGTVTEEGHYSHTGSKLYNHQAQCSGGHRAADSLEQITSTELDLSNTDTTVLGDGYHEIDPEFTIGSDGSVTPVIPDTSITGSVAGDQAAWEAMLQAAQEFIDSNKDHCTTAHLQSVYDRTPHGYDPGEYDAAWGDASVGADGGINVLREVITSYRRTGTVSNANGWLLWNEPFDSEELVGIRWPESLKE